MENACKKGETGIDRQLLQILFLPVVAQVCYLHYIFRKHPSQEREEAHIARTQFHSKSATNAK
jgi:hypothetical protein